MASGDQSVKGLMHNPAIAVLGFRIRIFFSNFEDVFCLLFKIVYLYVYVLVWAGIRGKQKRSLDALELKLQVAMIYLMWELGVLVL